MPPNRNAYPIVTLPARSKLPNLLLYCSRFRRRAHPSCGAGIEERDGGIVPLEPKACPSAAPPPRLGEPAAQTHVGVIAWSRTGDPDLGDWGPPEVMVRSGVIPDEFEAGGGVE
jgi:hypothetical protein